MLNASLLNKDDNSLHFDFSILGKSKTKETEFDTGDRCAKYFHNFPSLVKTTVDCTSLTDL